MSSRDEYQWGEKFGVLSFSHYGALPKHRRRPWNGKVVGGVFLQIDVDSMEKTIVGQVVGGPKVIFSTKEQAMRWVETTAVLATE